MVIFIMSNIVMIVMIVKAIPDRPQNSGRKIKNPKQLRRKQSAGAHYARVRSTSLLSSGGQFQRSGSSEETPRLTCMTVRPAAKVPEEYCTPCQQGVSSGPIHGKQNCPP